MDVEISGRGASMEKFGTDHVLDIWKICIAKPSAKEALMLLQTSLLHVLEPCWMLRIPTQCPLASTTPGALKVEHLA